MMATDTTLPVQSTWCVRDGVLIVEAQVVYDGVKYMFTGAMTPETDPLMACYEMVKTIYATLEEHVVNKAQLESEGATCH